MKTIIITDDEFNQKAIVELSSDANLEDVFEAFTGMLVSVGYSYKKIKEYLDY